MHAEVEQAVEVVASLEGSVAIVVTTEMVIPLRKFSAKISHKKLEKHNLTDIICRITFLYLRLLFSSEMTDLNLPFEHHDHEHHLNHEFLKEEKNRNLGVDLRMKLEVEMTKSRKCFLSVL